MNQQEFITNLQRHLTGKVTPKKLQELTQYYNDYIDSEIRKGKSEEEVLHALGDPRLLAKSIVEAEGRSGSGYQSDSGVYEEGTNGGNGQRTRLDVRAFVTLLVILLLLVIILSAVFGIIGFVLQVFVRYILPVAVPIVLIYWLICFLRGR